jgi:hypothetical protein
MEHDWQTHVDRLDRSGFARICKTCGRIEVHGGAISFPDGPVQEWGLVYPGDGKCENEKTPKYGECNPETGEAPRHTRPASTCGKCKAFEPHYLDHAMGRCANPNGDKYGAWGHVPSCIYFQQPAPEKGG